MPTPEAVRNNRWLRWLGPALLHPRLWHTSRRGLALGLALGVFFGLLIPIAQIPLSAAAAVALRANLPMAMASTLVTNPATFGPVYYAAWRVGSAILGEPVGDPPALHTAPHAQVLPDGDAPAAVLALAALPAESGGAEGGVAQKTEGETGWWSVVLTKLTQLGKPLLVGLVIFACIGGLLCYLLVTWVWILRVRLQRRRRLHRLTGQAGS